MKAASIPGSYDPGGFSFVIGIFHPCPGKIDAWKIIHFPVGNGPFQWLMLAFKEGFFLPRSFEKSPANQRLSLRQVSQKLSSAALSLWLQCVKCMATWCLMQLLHQKVSPHYPSLRHNLQLEGLPAIKKGVSCGHNMFLRDLQKDLLSTSFQAVMGCCNFEAADLWRENSFLIISGGS